MLGADHERARPASRSPPRYTRCCSSPVVNTPAGRSPGTSRAVRGRSRQPGGEQHRRRAHRLEPARGWSGDRVRAVRPGLQPVTVVPVRSSAPAASGRRYQGPRVGRAGHDPAQVAQPVAGVPAVPGHATRLRFAVGHHDRPGAPGGVARPLPTARPARPRHHDVRAHGAAAPAGGSSPGPAVAEQPRHRGPAVEPLAPAVPRARPAPQPAEVGRGHRAGQRVADLAPGDPLAVADDLPVGRVGARSRPRPGTAAPRPPRCTASPAAKPRNQGGASAPARLPPAAPPRARRCASDADSPVERMPPRTTYRRPASHPDLVVGVLGGGAQPRVGRGDLFGDQPGQDPPPGRQQRPQPGRGGTPYRTGRQRPPRSGRAARCRRRSARRAPPWSAPSAPAAGSTGRSVLASLSNTIELPPPRPDGEAARRRTFGRPCRCRAPRRSPPTGRAAARAWSPAPTYRHRPRRPPVTWVRAAEPDARGDGLGGEGERRGPGADDALVRDLEPAERARAEVRLARVELGGGQRAHRQVPVAPAHSPRSRAAPRPGPASHATSSAPMRSTGIRAAEAYARSSPEPRLTQPASPGCPAWRRTRCAGSRCSPCDVPVPTSLAASTSTSSSEYAASVRAIAAPTTPAPMITTSAGDRVIAGPASRSRAVRKTASRSAA